MEIRRKTIYISKYTFADFFDRTFKMAGRTGRTALLSSAGLFIPVAVIYQFVFAGFFRGVTRMIAQAETAKPDYSVIVGPYVLLLAVSVLAALAMAFISTAVTFNASEVAAGRSISPWESIVTAWRRFFGRVVLQELVKMALLVGVMISAFVPIALLAGVSQLASRPPILLIVIGSIWVVGIILLLIWLNTALFLSSQAIVFDGETVFGSLGRSIRLVRGNWWRLFGTMLLSNLIFSFSVGLITYPIVGVSFLPHLSDLLNAGHSLSGGSTGGQQFSQMIVESMAGAGGGLAVATLIENVVYALIFPPLWSLFYIDLKVRRPGELSWRRRSGITTPARQRRLPGMESDWL